MRSSDSTLKEDKTMDQSNWLVCQVIGVLILVISFLYACVSERIFSSPFDVATLLGIFLAMATTPLFWIGLGLEELGRIKRKKSKENKQSK